MPSILVADDDKDGCEVVARYLRQHGYRVSCASDGQEALTVLLASRPDLLLLDLRMPKMDGIALLEVVRSYLRWHALPVIVLTGNCDDFATARISQLGVRHVFQKANYELDKLLSTVRKLVPPERLPAAQS